MYSEFVPDSLGTTLAPEVTHPQSPALLLPVSTTLGQLAFLCHMPVDILPSLGASLLACCPDKLNCDLKALGFHNLQNHGDWDMLSGDDFLFLGLFSDRRAEHEYIPLLYHIVSQHGA